MSDRLLPSVDNDIKTALFEAFQYGHYQHVYQLLESLLQQTHFNQTTNGLEKSEQIIKQCLECRESQQRYQQASIEAQQRECALRREFSELWQQPQYPPSLESTITEYLPGTAHPTMQTIIGGTRQRVSKSRVDDVCSAIARLTSEPSAKPDSFDEQRPGLAKPDAVNGERYLTVYSLGEFRVFDNDRLISHWPNSKSKDVFKYLLLHRQQAVKKEVLMDLFWPDADLNHARNSLNVAIYRVRRTLSLDAEFSPVLFREDCYYFNPQLSIWLDAECFLRELNQARQFEHQGLLEEADQAYRTAEALYLGDLLKDDIYESWILPLRQRLREELMRFLQARCEQCLQRSEFEQCIEYSNKILSFEPCHEQAHRHIMMAYSRLKQNSLAVRQYHLCVDRLQKELSIVPSMNTVNMYQKLRHNQPV